MSAAVVQPILAQEGLLVQVELLVQGEPQVQVELQVPAGSELAVISSVNLCSM